MKEEDEKYGLLIIDMQKDFVLPGAPFQKGAAVSCPKIRSALLFYVKGAGRKTAATFPKLLLQNSVGRLVQCGSG